MAHILHQFPRQAPFLLHLDTPPAIFRQFNLPFLGDLARRHRISLACSTGARKVFSMASPSLEKTSPEQEVEEEKFFQKVNKHQKSAARLPHLEEARTVLDCKSNGTLSTVSQKYVGFPVGSMVAYAADMEGRPILAVSSLSPHTRDLLSNPKCSLLVPKDPLDRSDTIITVVGEAVLIDNSETHEVRATYLKKHPDAFWVDFGDFMFFRINPKNVRFVTGLITGLASVADFTGDAFKSGKVDQLAQFSMPIASHMNKDHAKDTQAIVEHSIGVKVDYAIIEDLDRLGLNIKAGYNGKLLKLRLPFPQEAQDRKNVKELIVEMLGKARSSSKIEEGPEA